MRFPAPSEATPNAFNRGNVVERLIGTRVIRFVLPELARGAYAGIDLRQLPVGLKGYYRDHWDRMGMNQTPAALLKINLLYLLSVTRTPISQIGRASCRERV